MSYKAPPSIETYAIIALIGAVIVLTPFIAIAALIVAIAK